MVSRFNNYVKNLTNSANFVLVQSGLNYNQNGNNMISFMEKDLNRRKFKLQFYKDLKRKFYNELKRIGSFPGVSLKVKQNTQQALNEIQKKMNGKIYRQANSIKLARQVR